MSDNETTPAIERAADAGHAWDCPDDDCEGGEMNGYVVQARAYLAAALDVEEVARAMANGHPPTTAQVEAAGRIRTALLGEGS